MLKMLGLKPSKKYITLISKDKFVILNHKLGFSLEILILGPIKMFMDKEYGFSILITLFYVLSAVLLLNDSILIFLMIIVVSNIIAAITYNKYYVKTKVLNGYHPKDQSDYDALFSIGLKLTRVKHENK